MALRRTSTSSSSGSEVVFRGRGVSPSVEPRTPSPRPLMPEPRINGISASPFARQFESIYNAERAPGVPRGREATLAQSALWASEAGRPLSLPRVAGNLPNSNTLITGGRDGRRPRSNSPAKPATPPFVASAPLIPMPHIPKLMIKDTIASMPALPMNGHLRSRSAVDPTRSDGLGSVSPAPFLKVRAPTPPTTAASIATNVSTLLVKGDIRSLVQSMKSGSSTAASATGASAARRAHSAGPAIRGSNTADLPAKGSIVPGQKLDGYWAPVRQPSGPNKDGSRGFPTER